MQLDQPELVIQLHKWEIERTEKEMALLQAAEAEERTPTVWSRLLSLFKAQEPAVEKNCCKARTSASASI